MNALKKLFLNEKFILALIIFNALLIFIQAYPEIWYEDELFFIDNCISILFLLEVIFKSSHLGFKEYIKSFWNKCDVILVLLSLPAILIDILPDNTSLGALSTLLILRVFRVFKFFRLMKFFPKVEEIFLSASQAMKSSSVVLAGFFVFVFMASTICCFVFRDLAPVGFGDPLKSFYSIFQVFTVEGWGDIPKAIIREAAEGGYIMSEIQVFFLRFVFMCFLLIGGIFGLSIVNSLFAEAMVNNSSNEELEDDIKILEKDVNTLKDKINTLENLVDRLDLDKLKSK